MKWKTYTDLFIGQNNDTNQQVQHDVSVQENEDEVEECRQIVAGPHRLELVEISCRDIFFVEIICPDIFSVEITCRDIFSVEITCRDIFSVETTCRDIFWLKLPAGILFPL